MMRYMDFIKLGLFVLGAFTMPGSYALDSATMNTLIQKELDSLRTYSVNAFMDLWSPKGRYCSEAGCLEGLDSIKAHMDAFEDITLSLDCDTRDNCFFLEGINKASCSYSCSATLKANPGCVGNPYPGMIVFEWDDEGLLVNVDDFFGYADFEKSIQPCINQDEL